MLAELQRRGYAGIEASLTDLGGSRAERRDTVARLARRGLRLVAGVYSSWVDYDPSAGWDDLHRPPSAQLAALAAEITELGRVVAGHEEVLQHVNAHAGGDGWSEAEAAGFFQSTDGIAGLLPAGTVAGVSFETHRARPLGSLFATARLCDAVPGLRLTLDLSHWVVVAERLLGGGDGGDGGGSATEARVLAGLLDRVDHLHARVGAQETPQLPPAGGPREWTVAREAHHAVWRRCWELQRRRGRPCTATPEYGPPPEYTPVDTDGVPLYDVWAETERAAVELRARFGQLGAA